jgi:hypothetical protein
MRFEDEHSDPDRMVVHGVDIDMPVHSANPAALAFLPAMGKCFTAIGSQTLRIARKLRRKTVVLLLRPPQWTSSPAENEK